MPAEPATPPSPPREACTVQERIAIGTAGVVYRAVQTAGGREVTFKLLSPKSTHPLEPARVMALRWRLEALQHPLIASLLDAYEDPEGFVMVTPWFAAGMGGNEFPLKVRKLTKQEARLVAMRLCGALLVGEQQHFPHGDIKPSNVVLADRGQQGLELQIQDWGLSVCREEQPSETIQFMAPERHHGHPASSQGDLFSAAATLWFLLTGESPAYGDSPQEVLGAWGLFDPSTLERLRPDLDEHFRQWLAWLLRWQPGDRPPSVSQALDVLNDVMSYAAAIEAQTKSEAIAAAAPAPAPEAPAPQQAAPAPALAPAPAPAAAAKPTAARPAVPVAARPAAPRAAGPRLQLPVAAAAPAQPGGTAAQTKAKDKAKDKPPKEKLNNGQRAMAIVMALCVIVGIGIAFVAWAEDRYGHDWRQQLTQYWRGKFEAAPAPVADASPSAPSKPLAVVPAGEASSPPAKAKAKTKAPAASKPAKTKSAAPKPFATDKFDGSGDLEGRTDGSGWKGPWKAQHATLEKNHAVLGGGNECSASRALGTIRNLADDYVNLSLMITHPGEDAGPLKLDILSADGKALVAPAYVAFEDGKVRVSIEGADKKIEVPAGKPFRLLVRWDWKTKKSGGKRQITVSAYVDPSGDPEKNKDLPNSVRTIGERALPASFTLALVYEKAAQPVKVSDLRVGRYLRDALP